MATRVLTEKQRQMARERQRRYREAHPERCASATAAWQQKHADKLQESREANREKKRAYDAQYRIENVDRRRENTRRWAAENPQKKRLADAASHAARDKEVERARLKKWHADHPGAKRAHEYNRRDRKRGGKLSSDIVTRLMTLQRGLCACCMTDIKSKYHVDHIMPLARGGENVDSNAQLLCPPCNMQKKAKHPVDFMQQRGFLL